MKMILRYTCVCLMLILFTTNIQAQFDPNKVCRVEGGKIIFRFNLQWDEKQKKEISNLFSLDSVLIEKAYQGTREIIWKGAKWKVKKLHTNQVELSISLNTINHLNDTIHAQEGNRQTDVVKNTNRDYVLLMNDSWLKGANADKQEDIKYGVNNFVKNNIFQYKEGIATFFLPGFKNSTNVFIAGSFNNWNVSETPMQICDSGWVVKLKLIPGKHLYKYIVNAKWILDPSNKLKEDDGFGNINSVVFCDNYIFKLTGRIHAHNVFLAGNFNNWNPNNLRMNKGSDGWFLPVYLKDGTHTYKFIVDGNWILDPDNPMFRNDGSGHDNSVIGIGDPYLFKLKGYESAKAVFLAGSFNSWNPGELKMDQKTTDWQISYILAPGNYEYKFIVDGKWITDPENPLIDGSGSTKNSVLVFHPNYTFTLNHHTNARQVIVSGNFNQWRLDGYRMIKKDSTWIFPIYLLPGKTIYKYLVDNTWILDPDNDLWEENQYGTGNSILWKQN